MELINKEFDRQMKNYFYELATCDETEFNIFIYDLENENLKPNVKKYMKTFLKYVKEARTINESEVK